MDLIDAILLIQRKSRILLIITLAAIITSGILNLFFLDKVYTSSLTLIISNQKNGWETRSIDYDDIILGEKLVDTYSIIAKSDPVLEKVIKELDLNITVKKLSEQIIINNQPEKRLMEVIIEDKSPQEALHKANVFIDAFILEINNILNVNNIQIISFPKLPIHPIRPNVILNLLISIFVGLAMGIIIIYSINYMDHTLENLGKLESRFKLPILARISEGEKGSNQPYIEFVLNHFNGEVDNYNGIMLITSSIPSRMGNGFINSLSKLITALGKSILVLDYNLDNAFLYENINIKKTLGLIDFLKEEQKYQIDNEEWTINQKAIEGRNLFYRKYVRNTDIPNLDIIPIGIFEEEHYRLLLSKSVKILLDMLIKDYDLILINGLYNVSQTDLLILGQWTNEIILIENFGESNLKGIERVIEKLGPNSNKVKGFVIHHLPTKET